MFEEWKKRSVMGKEAERIIWLSKRKKIFKEMTDKDFERQMKNAARTSDKPFENPEIIIRRHISEEYIDTMQTFIWGNDSENSKVIIYLHGGAYAYQPVLLHFTAVDDIARKTNSKVYFPIYPKIPKYCFRDVYPLIDRLYGEVLKVTEPQNITIMGDSAGGGLALGFINWLADFNLPMPKNLILLSPWLDVTMSNKLMEKYEKKDPLLSIWGLERMGRLWAGGESDLMSPYVSPIYGINEYSVNITLFVGTHELFYPEIIRFHRQLAKQKTEHNLIIAHKLNHVFPIMPIPEGRRSKNIISEIING